MNRIEELRKLAEDVIAFEKSEPHNDDGIRKRLDYLADTANPQTLLALLDLIELQHRALESYPYHGEFFIENLQGTDLKRKSIAAYNKFKEQS